MGCVFGMLGVRYVILRHSGTLGYDILVLRSLVVEGRYLN